MTNASYSEEYFYIQRPQLGFELLFQFNHDERDRPDRFTDDKSYTYFERLDLKTEGWVYHPALLEYTFTISPEWEQDVDKSDGEKTKGRTFLQGYTAELIFLKYKPYSLTLFGNRSTSISTSNLAEKTKSEYREMGATLNLRIRNISTTIVEYINSETEKTGLFESTTERDELRIRSLFQNKFGDTRLNAIYSDLHDYTNVSSINTLTKEIRLQNIYTFPKSTNSLLSGLTLRDKSNEYFFERGYNLNESLFIRHRKNLSTSYNFRVDSYDQSEQRRESHGINFNLTHLLYENLTTTINVGAFKNLSQSGQIRTYSGGIHWTYIRKIPNGMINASVSHDYSMVDEKPNERINRSYVTGEIINVTDVEPAFLSNENIDINTIEVYDETQTILYVKDRDYRIEEIGTFVRIACVIGGRIDLDHDCSDGVTLSVNYEFIPQISFDYLQRNKSYGISLSLWNAFRIYYNFNRSKQRFLRGVEPESLSTSEVHTTGLSIIYKWSRTSAYYKDESSTSRPTEAWRLTETLTFRPSRRTYLTGSASFGMTRYKDIESGNDADRFRSYRIGYQMSLPLNGRFGVEGYYTISKGVISETRDSGIISDFDIRYNIYTLSLNYAFYYERDKTIDETLKKHQFMIRIRRELF